MGPIANNTGNNSILIPFICIRLTGMCFYKKKFKIMY